MSKPRKKRSEQYKPDPSDMAEADLAEAQFAKKHVKSSELKTFLRKSVGDESTLKNFRRMLLHSSCSRRLINSLIRLTFELVQKDPSQLSWARRVIETISAEIMEPKQRLRDAFFFPSDESEAKLIEYMNLAQQTMLICVFTITNNNLADAIRAARNRGVQVQIISDDECMKMLGSDVRQLAIEGFPVRVDLNERAHMHNKFVVIDDHILITGSFNWTKQAVKKNQENLIAIEDEMLAKMYREEFEKLFEDFEESQKKYGLGEAVSS